MLTTILVAIGAVLLVLVAIIAVRPSDFRISRSLAIAAPAPVVFAQVNDFHNWKAWSPWERLDPEMKRTHEGAPAGTGASYAWSGNRQVGIGRSTITESRENELIRIRLEFVKPFAATNAVEFAFRPDAGRTEVTWTMTGTKDFMFKAVGLFMDMDKMVGGQFEEGLANLKGVAEKPAA